MSARHATAERLGAGVGRIFLPLLVVILGVWFAIVAWPAILVAGIAIGFALRRWHGVPAKHYGTTLRVVLPITAAFAGQALVLAFLLRHTPALAITAGIVAAAFLSILILIFEGRIMQSIFDLVPTDQQSGLDAFVAGTAPAGQHADFHDLDPEAVTAAIKERVIGQDGAVTGSVTTAFRRARLARPNKPIATTLLVGATGAGKTELAKALAAELFDGRMVRIDCNELAGQGAAWRLIGPPPGHIGADQGSQVCREIGRLGTGVLLFDEIEKAHPDVLKTVMGLLDEARITEQSTSVTYSATGFLIVLTSNAAQGEIARIAAAIADPTDQARKVKDELKSSGFLPEVLARIDAIYPFAPLDRRSLTEIVGRFLMHFAADAGVELASVDAGLLIDLVTRAEKMKDYGVREVVRAVESAVVDGLLDLKDRGYDRALIRVVDGAVSVQPVAGDATATVTQGAQK